MFGIARSGPWSRIRRLGIALVSVALLGLTVPAATADHEYLTHHRGSSANSYHAAAALLFSTSPALGVLRGSVGHGSPVSWSVPGSNAEAEEAVDPVTHYIYTAWMSAGWIWFARSTDHGVSFGPAQIVAGSQSFSNNTTFAQSWDPSVVTSANGTVFVGFISANTSNNNLGSPFVAVSYDHGKTFAFSARVFVPGPQGASDRDFLAVAPNGTLFATWDYAPNVNKVQTLCSLSYSCSFAAGDLNAVFARSSDGGHTWSPVVHLSPDYPHGGAWSAPISVEPNGRIDVLYAAFHTAPRTLLLGHGHEYFTTSTNGGRSWTCPVLVGTHDDSTANSTWWIDGSLAVGSKGTLFATFDTQSPHGDIAWLAFSDDHGATWSAPIRVAASSSASAHIIQVIAGPRGGAYVAWLTNSSLRGWEMYVSVFSLNGSHYRLTSPTPVSVRYGVDAVWPGDTFGLVSLGDRHVSLAWGIGRTVGGVPVDNILNFVVSFDV
jgi:hypothetical protein